MEETNREKSARIATFDTFICEMNRDEFEKTDFLFETFELLHHHNCMRDDNKTELKWHIDISDEETAEDFTIKIEPLVYDCMEFKAFKNGYGLSKD